MRATIVIATLIAGLISGPAAQAAPGGGEWSANVALTSDYVFRGLTQTNEHPALQGSIDYEHPSGAYAGVWASNVSWFSDAYPDSSNPVEIDFYGGVKKSWKELSTEVGYIRYQYPGSYSALPAGTLKPNTDEVFGAVGWKWSTLKYSYDFSNLSGVGDSKGSHYLGLTVTVPLMQSLEMEAHAGRQVFTGANVAARLAGTTNGELYDYDAYQLTLTYALANGWSAQLAGTHTTTSDAGYLVKGTNLGADRVIASLSRSF